MFLSLPLTIVFNLFVLWDGVVIYSLFHDCDPMKDPTVNLNSADQVSCYINSKSRFIYILIRRPIHIVFQRIYLFFK